jgi:hypothetical protein
MARFRALASGVASAYVTQQELAEQFSATSVYSNKKEEAPIIG